MFGIKSACLCFLTLLLLTCCAQKNGDLRRWMQPNGKLKVLSTTAMIDDLVCQVAGGLADCLTLIHSELDPHSYQLVKGDDEKLSAAQLIFYNGLGLEHGPSLARYLKHNPKAISLGETLNPALLLEVEGQLDPHIWMDISLWSQIIPGIVEALSRLDPAHASTYSENGKQLIEKMRLAHQRVWEEMQEIPDEKRYLVTSHDAFNYFARAYLAKKSETRFQEWSKRFAAPEGLAPDSQLSATDIQKIIDHLLTYRVSVLFPESNVSRDSIRKIVQAGREHGLNLTISDAPLYGDAMGRPGSDGDSYLKMLEHNARVISHHLKGES